MFYTFDSNGNIANPFGITNNIGSRYKYAMKTNLVNPGVYIDYI